MAGPSASATLRRSALLWVGGGVAALGVLLLLWMGPGAVRRWQHKRFLTQGKALAAAGEVKEAAFTLRKAILKDPRDPEGYRAMAALFERAGAPLASQWWARAVDAGATNASDRLAWATAALRSGDVASASRALSAVQGPATGSPSFHKLSGVLATALHDPAGAGQHFAEAVRLEPTNPAPRLNLAAVQLASTNPTDLAQGRAALSELAKHPEVRREALRHLVGDALRRGDARCATDLSRQLLQETNATLSDHILHLDTLKAARSPELSEALRIACRFAGTNTGSIFEVGRWMYADGRMKEALEWVQAQPGTVQRVYPLRLLVADCFAGIKDPAGLARFLDSEPWGEEDYHRLCLQARLQKALGQNAAATALWRRALRMASTDPERLMRVLRLTGEWRWAPEYEETLAALVERAPGELWARQELATLYHTQGRTRQLHGLLGRLLELAPTNTVVKNNFAMTSMLLNPRDERGSRLAREAYEEQATNAQFAATYAFALLNQQKPAEALAVFKKLDLQSLEEPNVAAYYGLTLASSGLKSDAAKYLALAQTALLLPEETNLVAQAKGQR